MGHAVKLKSKKTAQKSSECKEGFAGVVVDLRRNNKQSFAYAHILSEIMF
jgi:hypothetical protein